MPSPPPYPGAPQPFAEGERVLLVDRKGRRYLQTLHAGGVFHFHGGMAAHDDLLGQPEGSRVHATLGSTLLALRPTSADWTVKAPRGAQVVYPKDQAMIVVLGDIAPGVTVVEAGAGSGALSCALLRAVGTTGRVVSFEHRAEHAEIAERNVAERFGGLPPTWELRREDIVEGLAGLDCDRIVLDLLDPSAVLPVAEQALHAGGLLIAYTPSVPQMVRLREAMAANQAWGMAQTVETLVRGWHVEGLAVRPDHRMVAHTAFLTWARRLPPDPRVGDPAETSLLH